VTALPVAITGPGAAMSTEQKELEQNALASRLGGAWTNFKQGKLLGFKMMAILLLLVAGIGLWLYISAGWKRAASKQWVDYEEANTPEKLEELAKANPKSTVGRLALLQIARAQLGPDGIDKLGAFDAPSRQKAADNIVKAREGFGTLLDQFKNDPVIKAQCLLGLAKAEAALVAVPTTPNQAIEFKGKIPKVVEYLDQLTVAAADTPWGTDAKKMADALRDEQSAASEEFRRIQRALFRLDSLFNPKEDQPGPISPEKK